MYFGWLEKIIIRVNDVGKISAADENVCSVSFFMVIFFDKNDKIEGRAGPRDPAYEKEKLYEKVLTAFTSINIPSNCVQNVIKKLKKRE